MSDFDYSLDFPCRPGMGCPCREAERAAIVTWLEDAKRGDLSGRYLASFIERGDHLGGDDE